MKKSVSKFLSLLPYDMLVVILSKVGSSSLLDLGSCMLTCKTLLGLSKYPEVLRAIPFESIIPTPYVQVPKEFNFLEECASNGNVHALFLCGLFNFFHLKNVIEGLKQLQKAAQETHSEAMYVYGMLLLMEGDFNGGSNYLTQLWKNQGIETVNQCHQNVRRVILELSVKQYREYDILLSLIEVGENCNVENIEEVCDECFIRKQIFKFMDYMI